MPASTKARTSSAGEAGVSSGALAMIEQPVASAPQSLRTSWLIGKFHGVKAATGPTGSLNTCATGPRRAARRCGRHARALGGKPLDDVGAEAHLGLRLGQRLAVLQRQQPRDGIGALAQQAGGRAQALGALHGRHAAPDIEAARRGGQRVIQVFALGHGHAADALAGGGVVHRPAWPAAAGAPLAVDVQQHIRVVVHGASFRCRGQAAASSSASSTR
jgi:hypothetical protein